MAVKLIFKENFRFKQFHLEEIIPKTIIKQAFSVLYFECTKLLTNLHSQTQNKASNKQQNTIYICIYMRFQFTWKEFYHNLKLNHQD